MLSFIAAGVDSVFRDPKSIFLTASAAEILIEGFDIDCAVRDFAGKSLCAAIRHEAPVTIYSDTEMKLGLLSMRTGEDMGEFTVKRGGKNRREMNNMLLINGKDRIHIYDVEECNTITGSEGSFFGPKLPKKTTLEMFVPEFCRSLMLIPTESKSVLSVQTTKMEFNLTNVSRISND